MYRVLPIVLNTGETLPTLVRRGDWIPVRVVTRWAVRRRRFECMESTLARDLRALGLLYEWGWRAQSCDLDEMLEQCEVPTGRQLDAFLTFLRSVPAKEPTSPSCLETVAIKAAAVRSFLSWALDPRNQGLNRFKSPQQIADELARLRAVFSPFTKHYGASVRILPLEPSEVEDVFSVIGPVRDSEGRCIVPLSFSATNPFRPQNQLRNWLMFAIAHQCGLRRGELLKLRIDDIPKPNDPGLKVRRRPFDRSDTRRHKPRVKTSERVIPISDEVRIGLRMYLSAPAPMGRPSGRTPYLFVSQDGHPLSVTAADEIPEIVCRNADVKPLSWHSLRHTWAEALADDLLMKCPEDQALAFIRELGGWKRNSNTPMHYIQNALAKRANEFLRQRNANLYGVPGENN